MEPGNRLSLQQYSMHVFERFLKAAHAWVPLQEHAMHTRQCGLFA